MHGAAVIENRTRAADANADLLDELVGGVAQRRATMTRGEMVPARVIGDIGDHRWTERTKRSVMLDAGGFETSLTLNLFRAVP